MVEYLPKVALSEVGASLDSAGVAWAVFAGAAAAAYGSDRPVTDVDVLVPASAGERLATLFPAGTVWGDDDGLNLDMGVRGAALRGIALPGIALPGIEILAGLSQCAASLSYDIDLDQEMVSRRTHHEVAGVIAPVIPPEDNILLKAIWRRGPEQGKHDWEDVQAMLAHLPTIDWNYLRWRLETCCSGPRRGDLLQLLVHEAASLRGG
jgi:hypothetical protein